ncbi:MAG TPA: transketolase [Ilumatobacteraceae bacterium]|nr:transketolase [Ilumatobacteraceae bacterium]
MPTILSQEQERDAISLIRGFAMDAPLYAKSGHQGTAMALAPLAHVLFSRVLRHDPANPHWPDRDRFILSNGHASILQYSMLYLAGYGLELDDIKGFRQWGSLTPGHPEAHHTTGIEVTTGPLGQGFANAVGMAIAERRLRTQFGDDVINHHTFVIAGDGCFMEGVSHEAGSLAGHQRLGNLICIYDDNHITIDGSTSLAYSDDAGKRFEAYGWNVVRLGEIADDCDALEAALLAAKGVTDRPSLLILRSHVADPSPDWTDRHEAHGNPFTAEQVSRTKAVMGIPDEPYWAPADLVATYRNFCAERGSAEFDQWSKRKVASSIDGSVWDACWAATGIAGWESALPTFEQGEKIATRVAIERAFNASLDGVPGLFAGAADLTGNTGTKLDGQEPQSFEHPGGRQMYYGIREHAMGSTMVGMATHGGVIPAGGTFFVFLDYMRPSVRLATLSRAKVVFVWTHDSVGVGEDGPTHQPVEQLATLRAIPGLQVIRPADANETVAAWRAAVAHDGPTALVLSRQSVTVCTDGSAVEPGAAVVRSADDPKVILVGTGSEVSLCVAAAEALAATGIGAIVVSMPSWDRFAAQSADYQDSVLPVGLPVLSVEAAVTFGWERYADESIGIDRFGASAPGDVVMDKLGINVANVVAAATRLAQ